jgi:hypothetical protein
MQFKKKWCEEAIHFSAKMSMKLLEVSLSCLHFSLMFLKEKSSLPIFCKCVEPWHYAHLLSDFFLDTFFFKLIDRLITLMCFQIWYLYILANGTCFFICKFLLSLGWGTIKTSWRTEKNVGTKTTNGRWG